jgi:hypothetical protein
VIQEDGINSGVRNIGRFFLALIPWAVAIGFMAWLGFWVALHQYRKEVDQERRAAEYVGAKDAPTSKVEIQVIPIDCTRVVRAYLNGEDLLLYAENKCNKTIDYMEWHWEGISPDGTLVDSGYTNVYCPHPTRPNDKAECRLKVSDDDRIKTMRVYTSLR